MAGWFRRRVRRLRHIRRLHHINLQIFAHFILHGVRVAIRITGFLLQPVSRRAFGSIHNSIGTPSDTARLWP